MRFILNRCDTGHDETWQQAASDLREQPSRTNMSDDFSHPAEK